MCSSETQCPLLCRNLTFDLEEWPWPWTSTTQNVRIHEVHMHDKYQVAIFNIAKVMANVNFFSDGRTDWHTDSSTAICHPTGGIKYKGLMEFIKKAHKRAIYNVSYVNYFSFYQHFNHFNPTTFRLFSWLVTA